MIIGNPSRFAIESSITTAYEQWSQMALGFFVIYVVGRCYGVKEPDATMMGVSFSEVSSRLARRGSHRLPSALNADAREIAYGFRRSLYGEPQEGELFFGLSDSQFRDAIYANHVMWAPDGDEAFDDGSYVLQFEDENKVRLLAFLSTPDFLYDPASLRELWLSQEEFYDILQEWRVRFRNEWESSPKVVPRQNAIRTQNGSTF